jgi:mono/diheme cytochrome c family protein
MMQPRILFALFLLAFAPLPAQDPPGPDPGAVIGGKGAFRSYCGACHGASARGDGPLAADLKVRPANLTEIAKRNGGEFPFEQVVRTIDGRQRVRGHGGGDMPVWGDAFRVSEGGHTEEEVQQRIRNLAHFLWSIQER